MCVLGGGVGGIPTQDRVYCGESMVFRPGTLTGDSGWGKQTSLGHGKGGSGVPVSDPGQKAGGTRHGYLDPWLVATCTEMPILDSRRGQGVEKAMKALGVCCARLKKKVKATN